MKDLCIRIHHAHSQCKRILNELITAAIKAADPQQVLQKTLIRKGSRLKAASLSYDLSQFRRIVSIGAGKASGKMAVALEQVLGERLESGIVIVKDGYGETCQKIQVREAAHPIPDGRGVKATRQILSLAHSLTKNDLLIVLFSGGASSLLCAPPAGLTLADKQRTTRLLLRSGAAIEDINVVRKHLSVVKGGYLAQATSARILTLMISDVLGDDPATIGSGPTVPDPTTFQDAIDLLKQLKIWTKVPASVQRHLKNGVSEKISETLKPSKQWALRNRHIILANNRDAVEGVAAAARRLKLHPFIFPTFIQGEAKEIGHILGSVARDLVEFGNPVRPPACFIAGGEPTVTVTGTGKGGRAQECVLAAAKEVAGLRHVFVAGFGTDGTDGPNEVAGALVDGKTTERASRKGVNISKFLDNQDSYHFFKALGGHIITGPTGTNVNDISLVLAL